MFFLLKYNELAATVSNGNETLLLLVDDDGVNNTQEEINYIKESASERKKWQKRIRYPACTFLLC